MRRIIFKDEIHFALEKSKLSNTSKDLILTTLFENPFDNSKQYSLKSGIKSWSQVEELIRKAISDNDVTPALRRIFMVDDDLPIPRELRFKFLNNENIAVFVGAGASRIMGYPSWDVLANRSIEYLLRQEYINYFDKSRIISEIKNPKEKLTIFHEIISKEKAKSFYENNFKKEKDINPYKTLVKFDWIKITANIDGEFYKALGEYYLSAQKEITQLGKVESEASFPSEIKRPRRITSGFNRDTSIDFNTIYQIHGSIENIENAVITTRDYIKTYYSADSGVRDFLEKIFQYYTVLFIGYGLQELEILENLTKQDRQHYALQGTYLGEQNLFKIKKQYLKTLNIIPIPFYLDFDEYKRQIDVLDSWHKEIIAMRNIDYYQQVKQIDKLL